MPINNFKERVKVMTAKEIIMAMVEGLQNPTTKIAMYSFGHIDLDNNNNPVCFGCAATNTIFNIARVNNWTDLAKIDGYYPYKLNYNLESLGTTHAFISEFERAIDALRIGAIASYNYFAARIGIATIKYDAALVFPHLASDYTPEQLQAYIDLANSQPE